MDEASLVVGTDLTSEQKRVVDLMHKLRVQILETLSVLEPMERAAVIYTIALDPVIREHMPAVMFESASSELRVLRERAQTCQCPSCTAKRAQA
jgi:hypothetical protein